jgi:hypothetical protein
MKEEESLENTEEGLSDRFSEAYNLPVATETLFKHSRYPGYNVLAHFLFATYKVHLSIRNLQLFFFFKVLQVSPLRLRKPFEQNLW